MTSPDIWQISYVRNLMGNDNSGGFIGQFKISGRVLSFRKSGGVSFGHIRDSSSKIQFMLRKNDLGEENYKRIISSIKVGIHAIIDGTIGKSSTDEITVFVQDFKVTQNVWKPFPSEWFGIADEETKMRKRYLQCNLDADAFNIFKVRNRFIANLRGTLNRNEFDEIETPILSPAASGAQARPFETHHNALSANLYMRIAPETYLKRALACGFDRVFEIGKNFRNEGISPTHMQEFSAIEWYVSNWDYMDNLGFFQMHIAFPGLNKGQYKRWQLLRSAPKVEYRDIFRFYANSLPDDYDARTADEIFKKLVRPNIVEPKIVMNYPAHMSPMAKRMDDDDRTVEQWQLIADGSELVKCYTELTDPVLQRQLLEEQMKNKNLGDDEAMELEEDFLECMEYGIPPCSGLGMGIDRLMMHVFDLKNIRDSVLFPTLLRKS